LGDLLSQRKGRAGNHRTVPEKRWEFNLRKELRKI
jgi:hypothetical protein